MVNKHIRHLAAKYSYLIILCFLLLLILISAALPRHLYKNRPVDSEVIVVEGWLPQIALNKAVEEYYSGNCKLMATTGGPLPGIVEMSYFGTLVFNTGYLIREHPDTEITSVKVYAYGTKADGIYPCLNLLLNDSLLGKYFVSRKKKEYEFHFSKYLNDILSVKVNFPNDAYTRWRDRNLYVEYIVIGDTKIPARSVHVYYDIDYYEGYDEFRPRYSDYAEYSAFILKYLGFKDSIVTLPVSDSKINRTYSCALALKEWYSASPFKGKPVNIVSLGPHSRRTWMTYKKVLGKNTDVGIIMVENERYNRNNWWRSTEGIKDTLHEMVSYIYTWIIMPFLNKELKEQ